MVDWSLPIIFRLPEGLLKQLFSYFRGDSHFVEGRWIGRSHNFDENKRENAPNSFELEFNISTRGWRANGTGTMRAFPSDGDVEWSNFEPVELACTGVYSDTFIAMCYREKNKRDYYGTCFLFAKTEAHPSYSEIEGEAMGARVTDRQWVKSKVFLKKQ